MTRITQIKNDLFLLSVSSAVESLYCLERLIDHPRSQRALDSFQDLKCLFRDLRFDIEYHIPDIRIGVQVLPDDVDPAFRKSRVDVAQHAWNISMNMENSMRAG